MYRLLLIAASLVACVAGIPLTSSAETVAIIGTGRVGSALGQRLAEQGHRIVYGSRDPASADAQALLATSGPEATVTSQQAAAQAAEIVVLAVPWRIVEDLTRSLGDLSGRIIIDPTNPARTADDGLRDYPFDGSNAERIQTLAPQAYVVKAFNTLSSQTMLDPAIARSPISVPIAGDDPEARRIVAELVAGMGLEPVEVGPLRYARIIEGLHFLRYNAGQVGESRINFYFPADPE